MPARLMYSSNCVHKFVAAHPAGVFAARRLAGHRRRSLGFREFVGVFQVRPQPSEDRALAAIFARQVFGLATRHDHATGREVHATPRTGPMFVKVDGKLTVSPKIGCVLPTGVLTAAGAVWREVELRARRENGLEVRRLFRRYADLQVSISDANARWSGHPSAAASPFR